MSRVRNHYDFLSTSHVELQWRLMVDGRPTLVSGRPMPMATAAAVATTGAGGGHNGEDTAVAASGAEKGDYGDDGGGLWDRLHQPGSSLQRAASINPRSCSDVALPITLVQAMDAAQALQVRVWEEGRRKGGRRPHGFDRGGRDAHPGYGCC